jgi:hypothetical protein
MKLMQLKLNLHLLPLCEMSKANAVVDKWTQLSILVLGG